MSPSGDGLLADLFLGRPRSRSYPKFNIRRDIPRQRVTVEEAIRVGTLHGAYASYEEQDKGSIESGKLADLVVLGQDPARVEPSSLIDIPILRTMVGGRWVFEA